MALRVVVQSGGTASAHVDLVTVEPIPGSRVTLIQVHGLWRVVGQAITSQDGTCEIDTSHAAPGGFFYATAEVGPAITMMAIVGTQLPHAITINELTTVAAVYSASQFLSDGRIGGDPFGLRIVAGMNANLVAVATGEASPVLTSSPNANETITWRETHALANLLAFCVRGGLPACEVLFALTTPPGSLTTDTIAAMHDIARRPANQVQPLFELSRNVQPYQPALERAPDAWTLAVKVNDSGSDQHMFGGPGNLAFDRQGRAWIANNVVQGQPYSTEWSIVLEPDGKPAPISPITGGGLLGPGFGVAIDRHDRAWFGNFGWGGEDYYPDGSVSLFDPNGQPVSVPNGYPNGLERVQGVAIDEQDNVWMASYGNGSVVVYPGGDPTAAVVYPDANSPGSNFLPFDVAIADDGTAWVTNSNSVQSTLCHFELANGQLTLLSETPCGRTAKGVVIDEQGNVWVASGGDDHVYAFDANGSPLGRFQGGGMSGPWGICLDGDGHVWVADFGPLLAKDEQTNIFQGRLTQLAGSASPKTLGHPLTPDTGYTLPSAGSQVLLHDGTPLYGEGKPPSFTPMMRTTGLNVDRAGNVWTCNNWKPDFYVDHNVGNPGGDGMIIWVGVARPVRGPGDASRG